MIENVRGIGVDAGMIIVADIDYLKSHNYDKKKLHLGKIINVPAGNYKVAWSIKETWNGHIRGTENIKVTSGRVAVIDPCYVLQGDNQERWIEWLKDNKYGEDIKDGNAFVIAKMGGDGEYNVELEFNKNT